jgi:sulfhydrogenase subunit alpha
MKTYKSRSHTIKVDVLARVEGEGGLYIKIKDDKVADLKFNIYEPPRFFEGFLRGRKYSEVPDITARICGICPIAYQMSSVHAMEQILGIRLEQGVRDLRRLLYCGEWIESHALHIFMLHAPDFLMYEDAIRMAKDHPDTVQMGLRIKKIGNALVTLIGGREVHPINLRVGGFYKIPSMTDMKKIREELAWARDASLKTLTWTASLTYPDFERDYEFVALSHPDVYAIEHGSLMSNRGLEIPLQEYEDHFVEVHVEHSNALHSVHRERGAYHVGPLARFVLNGGKLPSYIRDTAATAGLTKDCRNPFKSIIARSAELLYACDEAIRLIDGFQPPESPFVKYELRAGTGFGCTEAPRGILFHKYRIDEKGNVLSAKIVPPTSQNQKTIEEDLWQFVPKYMNLVQDKLTWQCEQLIRNYDPCISCATHFLKLKIDRDHDRAR